MFNLIIILYLVFLCLFPLFLMSSKWAKSYLDILKLNKNSKINCVVLYSLTQSNGINLYCVVSSHFNYSSSYKCLTKEFPASNNPMSYDLWPMTSRLLSRTHFTLQVHASPHRYHAAYIGACMLARLPNFRQSCVTRKEWNSSRNKSMKKWKQYFQG